MVMRHLKCNIICVKCESEAGLFGVSADKQMPLLGLLSTSAAIRSSETFCILDNFWCCLQISACL